jgi:hypothetical protein
MCDFEGFINGSALFVSADKWVFQKSSFFQDTYIGAKWYQYNEQHAFLCVPRQSAPGKCIDQDNPILSF